MADWRHPSLGRIPALRVMLSVALLAGIQTGCNFEGGGLVWGKPTSTGSGDNTPEIPAGETTLDFTTEDPGGGTTNPSIDSRFAGTWIASFGDDVATSATNRGLIEYAVRLDLTQTDQTISGSGTMVRYFRAGTTASDQVLLNVTGTASGDDALLVLESVPSTTFDFNPTWYLRLAGNVMAGMYFASDINDQVVRSGHAFWRKAGNTDIGVGWAAAFTDGFALTAKTDRVAVMTLTADDIGGVSGFGGHTEVRANDVPLELSFNVGPGGVDEEFVGLTFDGLDLAGFPIDWFGFHTDGLFVGAYAQFNADDALVRNGHATWYEAPAPQPSSFETLWVTAFADSSPTGLQGADYFIYVTPDVNGNAVTGNAVVLDESADTPEYRTYTIQNGVVTGSELRMDLVNTAGTFSWVTRLAGSVLVGAYQHSSPDGTFRSRGVAEWHRGSATSITGTWIAPFYDTFGAGSPEVSQLALVTISNVTVDGVVSGTGALRLAGERTRRLFSVTGTVSSDQIALNWSGTDLFGSTLWHLRKSGNYLTGTYTNYNSAGTVEFRGHALFVRTNKTASFTQ
jgi:hypothetical protein